MRDPRSPASGPSLPSRVSNPISVSEAGHEARAELENEIVPEARDRIDSRDRETAENQSGPGRTFGGRIEADASRWITGA